jgi:hypothetical protein
MSSISKFPDATTLRARAIVEMDVLALAVSFIVDMEVKVKF